MDILHVLPSFDSGGLGSLAIELIKAWPMGAQQVNHHAIAPNYPNQTKPVLRELFAAHCKTVAEVSRHTLAPNDYVNALQDRLTRIAPHPATFGGVVAYNFIDAVWTAMGVHRAGYRKRILQHVGTVLPNEQRFTGVVLSPYTEKMLFVPASETVRKALIEIGTPPERLSETVWNGVDLSLYQRPSTAGLEDPPFIRFGFTGRMAPGAKDWDALLKGFAEVRAVNPNARLIIAGDGPIKAQILEQAAELKLSVGMTDSAAGETDVVMLGNLAPPLVRAFLASIDVFVMAALPIEGMSMALVEAIAARKPIVATDAPANVEVMRGLGFEAEQLYSRTELGRGMQLAQDPIVRAAWINSARVAAPKLNIDVTAQRYARHFQ